MTLIEAAKNYYAAGLSVIPIGEKKTPSGKWKEAQYKLIEPTNNFAKAEGIGIVCGAVSGHFYCIDFDLKYDEKGTDTWAAFKAILTPEQKNVLVNNFLFVVFILVLSYFLRSCFRRRSAG